MAEQSSGIIDFLLRYADPEVVGFILFLLCAWVVSLFIGE